MRGSRLRLAKSRSIAPWVAGLATWVLTASTWADPPAGGHPAVAPETVAGTPPGAPAAAPETVAGTPPGTRASAAESRTEDAVRADLRCETAGVCSLSRTLLRALLADPTVLARSARVIPALEAGRPVGLKVVGIRARSLAHAVGLRNGDVLLSINGGSLATLEQSLATVARVADADVLEVAVQRRHALATVRLTIRP